MSKIVNLNDLVTFLNSLNASDREDNKFFNSLARRTLDWQYAKDSTGTILGIRWPAIIAELVDIWEHAIDPEDQYGLDNAIEDAEEYRRTREGS